MRLYKVSCIILAGIFIFSIMIANSMPILMDDYNDHPLSIPQYKDDCLVCHVRVDGSGPLSGFGEKYDRANLEFTDDLVKAYPNLFNVAGLSEKELASAFLEKDNKEETIVPGNEPFDLKTYYREECKNCHGKYGDGDPFQGVPAWANKKWINERAPKYDELLNIILDGKDKMIGHAGKITKNEAKELLDLVIKIAKKYS
ncbi:MAG: cytochrome c [Candidatus Marinimicrobia bacterium]|jgi:hypothetical protein|nr:cytochrome c [Candidatus Neomarinimicrobiota bacterium]MBT3502741.1 cytochrome c [Candidatus Neomarinimicrobiota bacterium]MBT3839760.1 cytochrome c [Candidatus Neomarinimicrobiota bacterium]MBT3999525.1 cytochrome c [Candidatus Neomarinimicrobiota bacterium]MBT4283420.1 cytochrome c [Candidatus Neomarinimicrobiota bacterium]